VSFAFAEATDVCDLATLIGRRLDSDLRKIANVPAITVFLRLSPSMFITLHQWRSRSLGVTSIVLPSVCCRSLAGVITMTRPGAGGGSLKSIT
jgi:hypothetical protein